MYLATPGRRLGAHLLDFFLNYIFGFIASMSMIISEFATTPETATNAGITAITAFVLLTITTIIQLIYMNKGQTIGKKILNLQVISQRTQEPFNIFQMLLREYIGKTISGLFGGLGWIWILIDDDNQGWHDKVFDSLVVETE